MDLVCKLKSIFFILPYVSINRALVWPVVLFYTAMDVWVIDILISRNLFPGLKQYAQKRIQEFFLGLKIEVMNIEPKGHPLCGEGSNAIVD